MPGLVLRIPVSVGDAVGPGQGVLVLEAMKMENEIKAPAAGVVAAIAVRVGQAVEKGQVLLQMGPAPGA
jgi:pyruvate carboxylase subunit B